MIPHLWETKNIINYSGHILSIFMVKPGHASYN